jgi:hypothetical protein
MDLKKTKFPLSPKSQTPLETMKAQMSQIM